jgi:CarD family transcriptional regulator
MAKAAQAAKKVPASKAAPAKKTVIKTAAAKAPAVKAVPVKPVAVKTPVKKKAAAPTPGGYKVGDYVVYPTHGVGKIIGEESQQIGGIELKMFVIAFEKDKMTLRVPRHRADAAGLRNISTNAEIEKAYETLKGRARTSRGMWSRRAQEYEAKINSGSLISVAEVVRDLHKNVDQSERSYSERMIYESAFSRMVHEVAAANKCDSKAATDKLLAVLKKQAA